MDPSLSKVTADWVRAQPCNSDFVSECDCRSGQNGAFKNAVRPKGGGSAKSPVDFLGFGSILQNAIGVRSGNKVATSLEEKRGVGIVETVQSDHGAVGEVDRVTDPA
jgi:hypothetical protein